MFLLPDEKIILKVNPHWLFLLIPLIEILFVFFVYILIACPYLAIIIQDFQGLCYIVSLFLLFFLGGVLFLDWKFNRLYITNHRLIKERGIIGKRFISIQLTRIQNVSCAFGIFGWLFVYGDLTIESAGTEGKMTFEGMPWPTKIKEAIEKEMQNQNK